MPARQFLEWLDKQQIPYVTLGQPPAGPLPSQALAKAVLVTLDGELALAVLPASDRLDAERLRGAAAVRHVALASEREVQSRFPGSEIGALPPLSQLYGLTVFVAERLAQSEEIAFAIGAPTEWLRMAYRDFERVLITPRVADFSSR